MSTKRYTSKAMPAFQLMAAENEYHRRNETLTREIKKLRGEVGALAKQYSQAKQEINRIIAKVKSQPPPEVPDRMEEDKEKNEEEKESEDTEMKEAENKEKEKEEPVKDSTETAKDIPEKEEEIKETIPEYATLDNIPSDWDGSHIIVSGSSMMAPRIKKKETKAPIRSAVCKLFPRLPTSPSPPLPPPPSPENKTDLEKAWTYVGKKGAMDTTVSKSNTEAHVADPTPPTMPPITVKNETILAAERAMERHDKWDKAVRRFYEEGKDVEKKYEEYRGDRGMSSAIGLWSIDKHRTEITTYDYWGWQCVKGVRLNKWEEEKSREEIGQKWLTISEEARKIKMVNQVIR